jgi:CBS-domain-containing membrane protein
MRRLLKKMRGDGASPPARPALRTVATAFIGCVLAVSVLALAAENLPALVLMGTFGASTLLTFGYPDAAFSQPRNILFGHILGTLVGVAFLLVFGPQWWSLALAVGSAVAIMMLTGTVHPPASSNPLAIFAAKSAWKLLLFPTVAGALLIVALGLIYNNLVRHERWPKHW